MSSHTMRLQSQPPSPTAVPAQPPAQPPQHADQLDPTPVPQATPTTPSASLERPSHAAAQRASDPPPAPVPAEDFMAVATQAVLHGDVTALEPRFSNSAPAVRLSARQLQGCLQALDILGTPPREALQQAGTRAEGTQPILQELLRRIAFAALINREGFPHHALAHLASLPEASLEPFKYIYNGPAMRADDATCVAILRAFKQEKSPLFGPMFRTFLQRAAEGPDLNPTDKAWLRATFFEHFITLAQAGPVDCCKTSESGRIARYVPGAEALLSLVGARLNPAYDIPYSHPHRDNLALIAEGHASELEPMEGCPEIGLISPKQAATHVNAVLKDQGSAPWLARLLGTGAKSAASEATTNKLQALGTYLYLCRLCKIDPHLAPGPQVMDLVVKVADPETRQGLVFGLLYAQLRGQTQPLQLALKQHGNKSKAASIALALAMGNTHAWQHAWGSKMLSAKALESSKNGRGLMRLATQSIFVAELATLLDNALRADTPQTWTQRLTEAANTRDVSEVAAPLLDKPGASTEAFAQARKHHSQSAQVANLWLRHRATLGATTQLDHHLWQVHQMRLTEQATWLQAHGIDADRMAQALDLLNAAPDHKDLAMLRRQCKELINRAARSVHREHLPRWAHETLEQVGDWLSSRPPQAANTPYDFNDAFLAHQEVAEFMRQQRVPVLIAVQRFAIPLLSAQLQDKVFNSVAKVEQAVAGALADYPNVAELLGQGDERSEYLLPYLGHPQAWGDQATLGRQLLTQLIHAMLANTLPALRDRSPQMSMLRGWSGRTRWNAGDTLPAQQYVPTLHGTLTSTAAPEQVLRAVTELSSCQSVALPSEHSISNLARILDGSRRTLVFTDPSDNVRARATLRLLVNEEDEPVLGLSKIYTAVGTDPRDVAELFGKYVRTLGEQLGVDAVSTHAGANPRSLKLASLATPAPDYWDEGVSPDDHGTVGLETVYDLG